MDTISATVILIFDGQFYLALLALKKQKSPQYETVKYSLKFNYQMMRILCSESKLKCKWQLKIFIKVHQTGKG